MPRSDRSILMGALCGLWLMMCALTLCASAEGAAEREPFREPDWVSMPATEEGVRAAREVLSRAQRVYAGVRNYEHVGEVRRVSRVIGSRVRNDWDDEEMAAAAFDRETGRYSHVSRGCRVWFDGARVIVRIDDLKAYREEPSSEAAAPENAESLSAGARMPMTFKFIRGAGVPLDDLLESMQITELVGVIDEKREGKDGQWVVMVAHEQAGNRTVRQPRRMWFDRETGMLRAMEFDQSASFEAQREE